MEFPLFTKELKEKWITALESGKYTACANVLTDGKNHCCLGVLLDIIPGIELSINNNNGVKFKGEIIKDPIGILTNPTPFSLDQTKINGSNWKLANINDNHVREGNRDYSTVIPIIKTIPTVD